MEKNGYMSLWIGKIESEENLFQYVTITYKNEDEWELPGFLRDYDIASDEYDEDFVEAIYKRNCMSSVSELLKGCSYDDIVIPNVEKIIQSVKDCNAAILMCDYQYDGGIKEVSNNEYRFKYVDTVSYR